MKNIDWSEEIKQAYKDLKKNKNDIENTKRGTTSSKPSEWKLKRGKPKGISS